MIMIFTLFSVDVLYHIDRLCMLNHFCIPGRNPTQRDLWNFYYAVEIDVLIFHWGFLQPCSSGMLACSFLFLYCLWLWYQGDAVLIKLVWKCSLFYFSEELKDCSWAFLVGRLLIIDSNSSSAPAPPRPPASSRVSPNRLHISRNLSTVRMSILPLQFAITI